MKQQEERGGVDNKVLPSTRETVSNVKSVSPRQIYLYK